MTWKLAVMVSKSEVKVDEMGEGRKSALRANEILVSSLVLYKKEKRYSGCYDNNSCVLEKLRVYIQLRLVRNPPH